MKSLVFLFIFMLSTALIHAASNTSEIGYAYLDSAGQWRNSNQTTNAQYYYDPQTGQYYYNPNYYNQGYTNIDYYNPNYQAPQYYDSSAPNPRVASPPVNYVNPYNPYNPYLNPINYPMRPSYQPSNRGIMQYYFGHD